MSKDKGIISRYRPEGWDSRIASLVKDCIEAGGIEIDNNRAQVEGFIRYCINIGADSMLDSIRAYGNEAIVRGGKILLVLSPIAVPGRQQYRDSGISLEKSNYSGPGRITFIPADKEIFKIPPGKISGGGNGGKD